MHRLCTLNNSKDVKKWILKRISRDSRFNSMYYKGEREGGRGKGRKGKEGKGRGGVEEKGGTPFV